MKEHLFRRREFIRNSALAAAGTLFLAGCSQTPDKTPTARTITIPEGKETPPLEALRLKQEVENKFEIMLDVISKNYLPDSQVGRDQSKIPFPTYWDVGRLQMLDTFLPILPEHFHTPDPQGRKLTITLGVQSALGERPHEAILNYYYDFIEGNKRRAFETLTHELTHTLDPTYTLTTPRVEDGVRISKWSPWYDDVEQALGEPFADFSLSLKSNVEYKIDQLKPKVDSGAATASERDMFEFYRSFQYGLGLYNNNLGSTFNPVPNEFVAIMSEQYVHGEKYFYDRYGEFIKNTKQLDGLYLVTKTDIFRNKEYSIIEE